MTIKNTMRKDFVTIYSITNSQKANCRSFSKVEGSAFVHELEKDLKQLPWKKGIIKLIKDIIGIILYHYLF